MFELCSSILAHQPPYIIALRCECGHEVTVDTNSFKVIKEDYVILKNGIEVTCDKCGASQPLDERYLPLEPQIIRNTYAPYAPKKGLFTRFIDSMANMTPEEILSISNQIAAYNTDFPDSSND